MFGLSAIPALAQGFGMCYLPSSLDFILCQTVKSAATSFHLIIALLICRRLMFGLSALPALAQGIGMCYLPSSPRFLLIRQRELEARQVLEKLYDGAKVEVSALFPPLFG